MTSTNPAAPPTTFAFRWRRPNGKDAPLRHLPHGTTFDDACRIARETAPTTASRVTLVEIAARLGVSPAMCDDHYEHRHWRAEGDGPFVLRSKRAELRAHAQDMAARAVALDRALDVAEIVCAALASIGLPSGAGACEPDRSNTGLAWQWARWFGREWHERFEFRIVLEESDPTRVRWEMRGDGFERERTGDAPPLSGEACVVDGALVLPPHVADAIRRTVIGP